MLRASLLLTILFVLFVALTLMPSAIDEAKPAQVGATNTPTSQPNFAVITSANTKQFRQVGRLGYGIIGQVVWSPNGKIIAVSGTVGVGLYSIEDLPQPFLFLDFADPILQIAFADNTTLVVSSGDEVSLWNIQSGQRMDGLPGAAQVISVHPDGHVIALANDSGLRLWFPGSANASVTLTSKKGISALRFISDGNALVAYTGDPYADFFISKWDLHAYTETQVPVYLMEKSQLVDIFESRLSSNGNWFAVTAWGETSLWDLRTGKGRDVGDILDPWKRSLEFSPDSKIMAVGDDNGGIYLWDTESGKEVGRLQDVFGVDVRTLSYSPDGSWLASGGSDGRIRLWDTRSNTVKAKVSGYGWSIAAIAFSSDGKTLTAVNTDTAWRWDVTSGKQILVGNGFSYWTGAGANPYNSSVALSSNARLIATGSVVDGYIRLWRPTGESRGRLETYSDVWELALSPDVSYLAAHAGRAYYLVVQDGKHVGIRSVYVGRIYIWDVQTGKQLAVWNTGGAKVTGLAFDPTGTVLAMGSQDGTVVMRVVNSGNVAATFKDVFGEVGTIAFNPDGTMFASAFASPTGFKSGNMDDNNLAIRLWDIRNKKQRFLLAGHTDFASGLAFSMDGSLLASLGNDHSLRLWDVKTGALLKTVGTNTPYMGNDVHDLAFSPDGKMLASANSDGTVSLWAVTP